MKLLTGLWKYRSTVIFLCSPLILLLLPLLVQGKEAVCGYCMVLMAIYWMTEVIPLAVTSFLPLILFPLLGIMSAGDVGKAYFTDTSWLFLGSLTIAIAVETTNLHKRIALRILTLLSVKPRCLMLGFMGTSFFLSMWILNTASTAMMLPVVEAVTRELISEKTDDTDVNKVNELSEKFNEAEANKEGKKSVTSTLVELDLSEGTSFSYKNEAFEKENSVSYDEKDDSNEYVATVVESVPEVDAIAREEERRNTNLKKGLTICIPYASSIGGSVTVTGTAPNLVLSAQYAELFPDANMQLSFATWLIYCLPAGLLFLLVAYIWLSCFYLGFSFKDFFGCLKRGNSTKQEKKANEALRKEYKMLGSISWSEATVLIIFVLTALLWFFRDPGFMPGWAIIFQDNYVKDGTVAVTMASLLFFLPSSKPKFLKKSERVSAKPVSPILTWSLVQKKFPWSVLFLVGGGFALAQGATVSGLSQWIGDQLSGLEGIDTWLIALIITTILCAFTEVASNLAVATLFIPILASMAQNLEIHPIYLLVPPILATSMAFMLPVATPPNAIAFAYGHLKVLDMVKAGFLLNIIGIAIVTLFINTYGYSYFGLGEFPEWAIPPNTTANVGG